CASGFRLLRSSARRRRALTSGCRGCPHHADPLARPHERNGRIECSGACVWYGNLAMSIGLENERRMNRNQLKMTEAIYYSSRVLSNQPDLQISAGVLQYCSEIV